MSTWQPALGYDGDLLPAVEHLDGVAWYDVPLPRRWHRCEAQTRGFINGEHIERCACGATYLMGGWIDKNSRRKQVS